MAIAATAARAAFFATAGAHCAMRVGRNATHGVPSGNTPDRRALHAAPRGSVAAFYGTRAA
jgi:hypothetical protein